MNRPSSNSHVGRLVLVAVRAVQRLDAGHVLLEDHVALDAHLGREHAPLGREALLEQQPPPGHLVLLHARLRAGRLQLGGDQVPHARVLGERRRRGAGRQVRRRHVLGGPVGHQQPVGHHQHHVVGPVVPVEHGLRDVPRALQRGLDGARHHVLAVLQLVLLLQPARDLQAAVLGEGAQVARAEVPPAVRVVEDHLRRGLRVPLVAHHHVVPRDAHLALQARGHLPAVEQDLHLHAGQRHAHRAQPARPGVRRVDRHQRRGLREPVALADGHADVVEETQHVQARGRAAHPADLDAPAHLLAHLREHQLVQHLVLQTEQRPGLLALRQQQPPLVGHGQCPVDQQLLGARLLGKVGLHAVVHLLEERGHAEEQRRPHLAQVAQQGVDAARQRHARAVGHHRVQFRRLAVAVGPGQEAEGGVVEDDVTALGADGPHAPDVVNNVPVHKLHALGVARRPRGVDDRGKVFRPHTLLKVRKVLGRPRLKQPLERVGLLQSGLKA
mmetsp:Transcript_33923/g.56018  ORF Transcript_33923/g.56018 Transcript_33923/m.56018 type:complete len:499 (+) Transcript_33923:318-1814(+)